MENDEFVDSLSKLAKDFDRLADELYKATKPSVSGAARSEVMDRARARLKDYEDFLQILTEGRRESAAKRCERGIRNIRERVSMLEGLR